MRSRVRRTIDERTGKLIEVRGNTVLLEDTWCMGHYSDRRMFCPRAIYPFWRETWLEREECSVAAARAREHEPMSTPSLGEQQEFWDGWNSQWRFGDVDTFMARQAEVAVATCRRLDLAQACILEVGCGTGWLGARLAGFGQVTGVDLSPRSIDEGQQRYPSST